MYSWVETDDSRNSLRVVSFSLGAKSSFERGQRRVAGYRCGKRIVARHGDLRAAPAEAIFYQSVVSFQVNAIYTYTYASLGVLSHWQRLQVSGSVVQSARRSGVDITTSTKGVLVTTVS